LLTALRGFLCSAKKAYDIAAGVGNTGNGFVSAERASTSPVDETWTLTATSATNFTVTGSVSGAQAAATVGTPYDNGIVAFTIIAGSTLFVSTDSFTFSVADGLGATEAYTEMRYNANYDAAGEYESILMGPGTSGADEIYTAIQTVKSAGDDYYNWRLMGMTAYGNVEMQYMSGITQGRLPRMLMWQEQIHYWFVANGRRYIVVAKISSVYETCYMGFALPYGLPTQFPYPLVIGGSACPTTTVAYNRYSSTDYSHRSFMNPYTDNSIVGACVVDTFDTTNYPSTLKVLSGNAWVRLGNYYITNLQYTNIVWPYCHGMYSPSSYNDFSKYLKENMDGSYPIFPTIIMLSSPSLNIMGELQGIFATTGFGGIAAEDTFSLDGFTYVAFPCTFNASRGDWFALKLE
jgi:hypothetical protein